MSTPLPAIAVRGMTKRFRVVHQASTLKRAALEMLFNPRSRVDHITALQDIDFTVAEGETVGIVGRNGSGKSTILTLLAGIYRPSFGCITVRGRIGSLLDLGAGFHHELTAEDNAIMAGMIHGLTRAQSLDRVPRVIDYAGLEGFADTKIKHFSSGMILRLGFSVVIHTEPDVLLVDEVLAVGDETFQRKCRETIGQFQRQGKSIVFVSHDLDTVAEVTRRVIWLDAGRLRMDGPSGEVLAAYRAEAAR
ncbi:MAG: ABC transporter ATP-binding protein [Armatimonadetes bacterium]|nr:ABC transporter ATP-binding protein [Armatimonadota bacterium]